jgi:hypothetical protein
MGLVSSILSLSVASMASPPYLPWTKRLDPPSSIPKSLVIQNENLLCWIIWLKG